MLDGAGTVIPLSGGRDFVAKLIFTTFEIHVFAGKNVNQHVCQKSNFYYGFKGSRLGQNVRNDRGIISHFHKKHDFDTRFTNQSLCFAENHDFHVLILNGLFFFRGYI